MRPVRTVPGLTLPALSYVTYVAARDRRLGGGGLEGGSRRDAGGTRSIFGTVHTGRVLAV